jgi:hypothetical protein
VALVLALTTVAGVRAQVPIRMDSIAALPETDTLRISPGTAFVRSLLVPGWGQFSIGSYTRGAIFVALQGTSAYMVVRTQLRLDDAKDLLDERTREAIEDLNERIATDTTLARELSAPGAFDAAIDSTTSVRRTRGLVESRRNQRQDWIVYLVVFTLASGVDAFVSAHLADFPARIEPEARPNGGAALKFTVPVGRRRR